MKRICKKCLLSEIDEKFHANINDYIYSLSDEIKVVNEEYQRRLSICRECENMLNGMCKKCGCFIETRAIKKLSYCPSEDKKW